MEMTTERRAGVLSLGVRGRIDGDSVARFEQAVEAAIAAEDRAVVLDLGALDYLSSAGLRAILLIAKTLWKQDGYFALCSVSDHVRFSRSAASTGSSPFIPPPSPPGRPRGHRSNERRQLPRAPGGERGHGGRPRCVCTDLDPVWSNTRTVNQGRHDERPAETATERYLVPSEGPKTPRAAHLLTVEGRPACGSRLQGYDEADRIPEGIRTCARWFPRWYRR